MTKDAEGRTYTYRVEEVVPAGYTASYSGYNITNTKNTTPKNPEYTTISGSKSWIGDTQGERPTSITVRLVNAVTGEVVQTKTVSATENWTYSFTNVMTKDAEGRTYTYRVEEVVPAGYTVSYSGYNITNTKNTTPNNPTYTDLSGQKTWVGDTDATRPQSIVVRLYDVATGNLVREITVTAQMGWKYTFTQVLTKDAEGKTYSYRVEEVVPAGYTASYQGMNIVNTKTTTPPEYTTITGTKSWVGDTEATRPQSIVVRLIDVETGKVVKEVTVTAATNWVYSFADIMTKDGTGKTFSYRVEEVVPAGYTVSTNGYNLINTKTPDQPVPPQPEVTTINGQKNWIGDTAAERPASIIVRLIDDATGDIIQEVVVSAASGWTYKFEEVVMKDADGNVYSYHVEEVVPAGYTASYNGYNITNTVNGFGGNVAPDRETTGNTKPQRENNTLPKTGDATSTTLFAAIALLLAGIYTLKRAKR